MTDIDFEALVSDEPEDANDPRLAYPKLSKERTYRSWPCATCSTRRDEHADQLAGRFPELDITDHEFIPALDVEL